MNKEQKQKLIAFCEKNAKEIKSKPPEEMFEMMEATHTCVLRPDKLPIKLSDYELKSYKNACFNFLEPSDIDRALKWVKEFCK